MDHITVTLPPMIRDLDYRMDRPLAAMTTAALGNLTSLDLVHGRTLEALNHLQLRTEAIDSSKIENVEASLIDYGKALLGIGANASAISMAAATQAMERLIDDAKVNREIRMEAILDAHRALMARDHDEADRAGRFRTVQNWIGGSNYSPLGAMHVPPPPDTVPAYLEDLFAFANRDDLPILPQAAIVHAQFESIHPFIDGNGRIGRALIHAVLRRRRATRHLVVPIASALVAHRERYFEALNDYKAGYAGTLVAMLSTATSVATSEARATAATLIDIRERWAQATGGTRPGTTLHRTLDLLPEEPIVNAAVIASRVGTDEADALAAIEALVVAGVLTQAPKSRKAPVWLASDILTEVEALRQRIQASGKRLALI